jgi:hypothetical protein
MYPDHRTSLAIAAERYARRSRRTVTQKTDVRA